MAQDLQRLAEVFGVLADVTRLRMLRAMDRGERTVGELARVVDVTPSAVSHQLQLLRAARLVRYRKQGRRVFYALDDRHVSELMRQGLEHLAEGG